ncbi:hypothetical protein OROGR_004980 [Orobanche gracilis]
MDHRGKNVCAVAVMITVLVLLHAGQASASCYGDCLENCFAAGGERIKCLVKCISKCRKSDESPDLLANRSRNCLRFGDDIDKVENCVNECESGKCRPSTAKHPSRRGH